MTHLSVIRFEDSHGSSAVLNFAGIPRDRGNDGGGRLRAWHSEALVILQGNHEDRRRSALNGPGTGLLT